MIKYYMMLGSCILIEMKYQQVKLVNIIQILQLYFGSCIFQITLQIINYKMYCLIVNSTCLQVSAKFNLINSEWITHFPNSLLYFYNIVYLIFFCFNCFASLNFVESIGKVCDYLLTVRLESGYLYTFLLKSLW